MPRIPFLSRRSTKTKTKKKKVKEEGIELRHTTSEPAEFVKLDLDDVLKNLESAESPEMGAKTSRSPRLRKNFLSKSIMHMRHSKGRSVPAKLNNTIPTTEYDMNKWDSLLEETSLSEGSEAEKSSQTKEEASEGCQRFANELDRLLDSYAEEVGSMVSPLSIPSSVDKSISQETKREVGKTLHANQRQSSGRDSVHCTERKPSKGKIERVLRASRESIPRRKNSTKKTFTRRSLRLLDSEEHLDLYIEKREMNISIVQ